MVLKYHFHAEVRTIYEKDEYNDGVADINRTLAALCFYKTNFDPVSDWIAKAFQHLQTAEERSSRQQDHEYSSLIRSYCYIRSS